MKSTVSEKPCKKDTEYPCLVISPDGNIYKMFSSEIGFLVYEKTPAVSSRTVTGHSTFKIFNGSVCLEN